MVVIFFFIYSDNTPWPGAMNQQAEQQKYMNIFIVNLFIGFLYLTFGFIFPKKASHVYIQSVKNLSVVFVYQDSHVRLLDKASSLGYEIR